MLREIEYGPCLDKACRKHNWYSRKHNWYSQMAMFQWELQRSCPDKASGHTCFVLDIAARYDQAKAPQALVSAHHKVPQSFTSKLLRMNPGEAPGAA